MTDKRKVSTDALETLEAGQDVGIDGTSKNPIGIVDPFINRIDEGCGNRIFVGERFWLVIYPRKINSLRHVWTHPDIPDDDIKENPVNKKSEIEKSKEWVNEWIESMLNSYDSYGYYAEDDYKEKITYETIMKGAKDYLKTEDYMCEGPFFEDYIVPDEFWIHFEIITGNSIPTEKKRSFFTCSC
jgi:hypothetical protein